MGGEGTAIRKWRSGDYEVSTDPARLDLGLIEAFLGADAYWSKGIPPPLVRKAIAGSIVFGAYRRDEQVAFARVVSDKATFAWVCDVFVVEAQRGQGLGKLLMECMVSHPDLQGLRRWMLATRDAHGLYRQFGFTDLHDATRFMERWDPEIYQRIK